MILNTTYVMHELEKGKPEAEKVWLSNGYVVNKWMPLVENSFDVKNWKIKSAYVFIQEMFGN